MTAPKALKRPGVVTTVLSKKPIFLLLGLIIVIVILLIFSIFDSGNSKSKIKQQETLLIEPGVSTTTDEEGLNLPKAPKDFKGVAKEIVSGKPPAPGETPSLKEPIQVVPAAKPVPKDPLEKQHQKQLLAIQEYHLEQQRKALEAGLIAYKKDSPVIGVDDGGLGASGYTQANSSSRIAGLKKEAAQLRTSINQGQIPNATASVRSKGSSSLSFSANQAAVIDSFDIGETGDQRWSNGYSMDQETDALSIKTGSIIPSVLITGINSTLPGHISCQVSQDVWDTATGYNLLIPQGTKIFGQYQNQVIMGQERLFVVWQRLIFPDGRTMTLSDMPGTDQLGYSGLKDQVDNHYLRIYGHALLMSLITGGTAYALNTLDTNDGDTENFSSAMGTALAEQMGQTTMSLLAKHMDMSPTLNIRPGYRLNVMVVKDLSFNEPYEGQL
ncbi:TrbI/VirB10 family protein [Desulfobacter sp.]|uniref:TrbI/VirB10 family protein n=1 Tax=Desulfobacter sp. TaxID=2294 RepID=UPI003D0E13A5